MTSTTDVTAEALAVLHLPAPEELTAEQQRGAVCVWCTATLDGESAVDLGEQPPPDRWFPRACRSCLARRAWRGFLDHAMPCEQCSGASGALCQTGRELSRLSKGRL